MTGNRRLAVVVKGWPRLSETFIAQELVALEAAGHTLDIWSLRFPTDIKRHPLHDALGAQVRYLPEYLHHEPLRVTRACARALIRPRVWPALAAWLRDLRRDPTRNRVRRFGQACVLAAELPGGTDALYAHFLHTPASVARYTAILRGLPWGVSAHAKDIWTSPEWEKREKLQSATHGATFLATCTGFGAEHLRALADDPSRVALVYHGLDLSRFPAPPERAAHDGPLRLLSVGRLVEKKGFDRLVEALTRLPVDLDWHWDHIGGGGGALAADLKARAEAAGIANRITWHGACDQPEVIAAMRAADIFVLPSRVARDGDRDGLPNVLMEAASQKLAILSTPVSAIPEFITDGVEGLLSDDAPEALAEAITTLARAPETRRAMGEAAWRRLTADFTMAPGIARLDRRLRAMREGA
ncbi:Glycosyltransferase involved in cell wall bisynthesis [Salinihabitans flavidus]|uniref:Glycosyltransferase involved in cell wall bisynthesis n=1 Tax=Salinihabitans flavidus TaxID=569882 RepID=A0A1H8MTW2_9RHOB|nr:glycosyltransferase [Salinihabitans flavidus]SEO20684.1 Glycosyltransferase involved in cell wall bisynthesis [Salinihabitans flavidus]